MEQVRKILIEVTPQEYQLIMSGNFNGLEQVKTAELILELERRCKEKGTSKRQFGQNQWTGQNYLNIKGELREDDKKFTFDMSMSD